MRHRVSQSVVVVVRSESHCSPRSVTQDHDGAPAPIVAESIEGSVEVLITEAVTGEDRRVACRDQPVQLGVVSPERQPLYLGGLTVARDNNGGREVRPFGGRLRVTTEGILSDRIEILLPLYFSC